MRQCNKIVKPSSYTNTSQRRLEKSARNNTHYNPAIKFYERTNKRKRRYAVRKMQAYAQERRQIV